MSRVNVQYQEQQRLKALHDLKILDTPPEVALDELVIVAANLYGAPLALVTLVDGERTYFKAASGTDDRESHDPYSFCKHAIESDEVLVVPDATLDDRVRNNQYVTGPAGVRFYAGAPITTSGGFRVGTVCILDTQPRSAESLDLAVLVHFARLVAIMLEHRASGSTKPMAFPPFQGTAVQGAARSEPFN